MPEATKSPPETMDPGQFNAVIQRQYQTVIHGGDPIPAANKVEVGWHKIDPIAAALPSSPRESYVLEAALDKSKEIVEAAAHDSRGGDRKRFGSLAVGMELDSLQVGIGIPDSDKTIMAKRSDNVLGDLREKEHRQANEEMSFDDMFLLLNARALNIQIQAETARTATGPIARAGAAIAQASLGGFIQECASHLSRIGNNYDPVNSSHQVASLNLGRFTELAFFTNQLLKWYDDGVTVGKMVRFAVDREDRPYQRHPEKRVQTLRRGFDVVVRNALEDATLFQVKSSKVSGDPYAPEIVVWKPQAAGAIESAQEIADAFQTVIANENDVATRQARTLISQYLGQ